MTETVWTDWLTNPGNLRCPVPEWAEDCEVSFNEGKNKFGALDDGQDLNDWDWSRRNKHGDITHYRYAIPASLYRLVKTHDEWPMDWPARIDGWARVDWLKAREDLGVDVGMSMDREALGPDFGEPCPNADDPVNHPTAADFLRSGLKHMEDRATTYDKPDGERSMNATVRAFEAITGISMTEEQGWLFMGVLKDVRSQQGNYRADNYEDRAAYAGLQGEAAYSARGKREEW